MLIEIYSDHANEIRLRLKGDNGELMPDGYKAISGAKKAVKVLKTQLPYAKVVRIHKDGRKEDMTAQFH